MVIKKADIMQSLRNWEEASERYVRLSRAEEMPASDNDIAEAFELMRKLWQAHTDLINRYLDEHPDDKE